MTKYYQKVYNLELIRNNLSHLLFELNNNAPCFFRIGKEGHHLLYRSMIEVLRHTSSISSRGRNFSKNKIIKYQFDNSPVYEIRKENVDLCKFAWRYSAPMVVKNINASDFKPSDNILKNKKEYLLGFYDLLAMIQTECFMRKYDIVMPINLKDKQIQLLEGLHEQVRNEYEHFIPILYAVNKTGIINSSDLCLQISKNLVEISFKFSNTIIPIDINNLFEISVKKLALYKNKEFYIKKKA